MTDYRLGSGQFGDGVVTITVPEGETESETGMADLPSSVAQAMMVETTGNIQANNRDGRNVATIAMGVLQAAMARNFDELGVTEGRSVSGVLATPLASPATGT